MMTVYVGENGKYSKTKPKGESTIKHKVTRSEYNENVADSNSDGEAEDDE